MSDGRDDDLYADRAYRPGPPPELREPPRRRSRALGVFVATFALAAFAGVVWYAYDQGLRRGTETTAPLIKADSRPTKVRPEQPGGLQVPNQDKLVYEAMRPGESSGAPRVERLLPPPERPVEPPAPPPPPPIVESAPSAQVAVPPLPAPEPSPAPSGTGIPPARIVVPAPAPLIPTPQDTAPPPAPAETTPPPPPPLTAPAPTPAAPPATTPPPAPVVASPRQAPAPAPVPAAPPPAAAPSEPPSVPVRLAAGNFRIQLGALRDEAAAVAEWTRLKRRHPDQLGGLDPRIQRVDLGPGKGVFYRIQSSPVSEASAAAICDGLKAKAQACIVVRP